MVYGKTGTTENESDGWFIGFTQKYTAGIWEGYDIPEHIPGGLYNTKFYMWSEIMKGLIQNSNHSAFPQPSGIVHASVCTVSGMMPTPLCEQQGKVATEVFIAGTEPTKPDTVLVQLPYVIMNGKKYRATTNTPPAEIRIGVFYNPPWPIPNVVTDDSKYYEPMQPDPRGGTVLPPLSSNSWSPAAERTSKSPRCCE